jgi:hypothetical protein
MSGVGRFPMLEDLQRFNRVLDAVVGAHRSQSSDRRGQ